MKLGVGYHKTGYPECISKTKPKGKPFVKPRPRPNPPALCLAPGLAWEASVTYQISASREASHGGP